MVKILILAVIIMIAFAVSAHKYADADEKPSSYNVLRILHLIAAAFIVVFATVHGVSHIADAQGAKLVTGICTLVSLWAAVVLGFVRKKNPSVGTVHCILPVIAVILAIVHVCIA